MSKEMVNHPAHYQGDGGMEAIDAIIGIFGKKRAADWCLITAFKYMTRMGKKDDEAQETGKVLWYMGMYKKILSSLAEGDLAPQ